MNSWEHEHERADPIAGDHNLGIGFDMFLLMERTPLDPETLRLFMHDVVPRLRAAAWQAD